MIYMVDHRFLRIFISGVVAFYAAILSFILLVDPYNTSPLQVHISGFNLYKPMSVGIDRHTKPFMVWAIQPATIFLGTSRIHQSIDPKELDGTFLAPAYNASVPASDLGLSRSDLEYYKTLDPRLRTVFIEIFLYNYLGQPPTLITRNFTDLIADGVSLFASVDTFRNSLQTVMYNIVNGSPVPQVQRGGFYTYPPGHDTSGPFAGFPKGIWDIYDKGAKASSTGKPELHPPAFDALKDLVGIARARGLELRFILTPQHAYQMYYIQASNQWALLSSWIEQITHIAPVISFSQPNEVTYEPVSSHMRYWNDPFHFSTDLGRLIQASLAGRPLPGTPANFMQVLTPVNAQDYVKAQRAAITEWAAQHPDFVKQMKEAAPVTIQRNQDSGKAH